ncbi:MAG TPA: hypothetical protein VF283_17310 [Bryobacteraceae bacterium]
MAAGANDNQQFGSVDTWLAMMNMQWAGGPILVVDVEYWLLASAIDLGNRSLQLAAGPL